MKSIIIFCNCLAVTVLLTLIVPHQLFGALDKNYQGFSASDKQTALWNEIKSDPYTGDLPTRNPSFLSMSLLTDIPYLIKSFFTDSDEMPPGRRKLIHTYGATARVELVITNSTSGFTGIFNSGGIGVARLSLAKQDETNFIPGMGLKILVNEKPSLNFQVMYSLDGQGKNFNFFENSFSNIIAPPKDPALKILAFFFAQAVREIKRKTNDGPRNERNLPLFEAASLNSKGESSNPVSAPYQIIFTPNKANRVRPDTVIDFRAHLADLTKGTVLYTVSLKKDERAEPVEIGYLELMSPFVASRYQDEVLFFQHASHTR